MRLLCAAGDTAQSGHYPALRKSHLQLGLGCPDKRMLLPCNDSSSLLSQEGTCSALLAAGRYPRARVGTVTGAGMQVSIHILGGRSFLAEQEPAMGQKNACCIHNQHASFTPLPMLTQKVHSGDTGEAC
jgi:hypothetical protein